MSPRSILLVILSSLTVLVAACSSGGGGGAGNASAPNASTSTTASGQTIALSVTGTGTANVTVMNGSNTQQHSGVQLPYNTTISGHPVTVGISGQLAPGNPATTITCEIDVPEQPPVINTSSGPNSVVNCSAPG